MVAEIRQVWQVCTEVVLADLATPIDNVIHIDFNAGIVLLDKGIGSNDYAVSEEG
jgi:hypothetical protein